MTTHTKTQLLAAWHGTEVSVVRLQTAPDAQEEVKAMNMMKMMHMMMMCLHQMGVMPPMNMPPMNMPM